VSLNSDGLSRMSETEKNDYLDVVSREPEITNDAKNIAERSGGELQGLEHRIKTPESVSNKLYERDNQREPKTVGDINDIIRYTEVHSPETLTDGVIKSLEEYESKDYSVERVKNSWLDENAPYKGINATLRTPDGQSFEVQYHTQESFDLKNGELHTLYEEARNLPNGSERKIELEDKMRELSSKLNIPNIIEGVKRK
jgi:hypothetical protein